MPSVIETIFGDRQVHAQFLQRYGLSEETHPYVELNLNDWSNPVH